MSGTSNAEPDGVVSKVKVKKQIKTIVHDLETILVDLRDVAKELQEVVHEIDSLTCDLQLEEDLTDSSKTDTLNSSSSSTTTTTTTASGDQPPALRCLPLAICPPLPPLPPAASASFSPAVLTVLRKAHPPPPPPRMTSARPEDRGVRTLPPALPPRAPLPGSLTNGTTLERNGRKDFSLFSSSSSASLSNDSGVPETGLVPTLPRPMPLLRHKNSRCPQAPPGGATRERERVRFSEKVQYHGYCPDCDLQYDVDDTDLRPQDEPLLLFPNPRLSPLHCCSSSSPSPPLSLPLPLPVPVPLPHHHHHHQYHMENGGLPVSHSFPPANGPPTPSGPHSSSSSSSSSSTQKPQKTILRKSTTTTV